MLDEAWQAPPWIGDQVRGYDYEAWQWMWLCIEKTAIGSTSIYYFPLLLDEMNVDMHKKKPTTSCCTGKIWQCPPLPCSCSTKISNSTQGYHRSVYVKLYTWRQGLLHYWVFNAEVESTLLVNTTLHRVCNFVVVVIHALLYGSSLFETTPTNLHLRIPISYYLRSVDWGPRLIFLQ